MENLDNNFVDLENNIYTTIGDLIYISMKIFSTVSHTLK